MEIDLETRFRMVKEWLSAGEIRALDLPDMPKSKTQMVHWLKQRREAHLIAPHQLRRMKGHNTGWEYHRDFILTELRAQELFFSMNEISEMNLPGVPRTGAGVRALLLRRRREGLIPPELIRRSFKAAGGMVYHYHCLPAKAAQAFEAGLGDRPRPRYIRSGLDIKSMVGQPLPPINEDYRPSPDAVLAQLGVLAPGARLVVRVPARTRPWIG